MKWPTFRSGADQRPETGEASHMGEGKRAERAKLKAERRRRAGALRPGFRPVGRGSAETRGIGFWRG
jgi:hypothetical protein